MVWFENRRKESDILYSQTPPFSVYPSTWQGMVDVARELMPEMAHMKTLGTITLPMPSLSKPNQAAKIIPAAQSPVKVLARLMGFAESLDDLVPNVVPVMPWVRQAVVVDPLSVIVIGWGESPGIITFAC